MRHQPTYFASSARRSANGAWFFAILAAALCWLLGWKWGAAAGVVALWIAIRSASSAMLQSRLEEMERTNTPPEIKEGHPRESSNLDQYRIGT
jgi:hypothetical protein